MDLHTIINDIMSFWLTIPLAVAIQQVAAVCMFSMFLSFAFGKLRADTTTQTLLNFCKVLLTFIVIFLVPPLFLLVLIKSVFNKIDKGVFFIALYKMTLQNAATQADYNKMARAWKGERDNLGNPVFG